MSESPNLFDDIAVWVPEPQRAQYWEMVGHLKNLSGDDEILRLCQAMGVLALITRQLPGELAMERKSWDAACQERHNDLIAIRQATEAQVEARTEKLGTVLLALDDTSTAMQTSADRVEAALRDLAGELPVEAMVAKLQASLATTLLQPAETAIARAAHTYEKMGDLTTTAHEAIRTLDRFTSRRAWMTSVLVCSALTVAILIVSWHTLRVESRGSLDLALAQLNARTSTNDTVLRQLNGLGRRLSLRHDPGSGAFFLILEDADNAWCGDVDGKRNAVITFVVKPDAPAVRMEP